MSDAQTKTEGVAATTEGITRKTAGIPGTSRSVLLVTLGAVVLRLALLLGRGDYVAFDEGWYLLLGRSLWSGDGYTLSGLRHVALSPLFPVLAGGLGRIIGDPVWAGRIVAAISSGLLVLPCWFVFRRLGGPRTARVGILLVAILPSLAPFVVPYWVGWDLWVGAEPLLHLFLFTAIALFLEAWPRGEGRGRLLLAVACGIAFGLAYLARPEAIVSFGLLGALAVIASGRAMGSRAIRIAACGLAFVAVAAPYWLYLHDSLGRWTITGRGVQVTPRVVVPTRTAGARPNRIETMLWEGDASSYIQRLYALDSSGTALAARYWGVQPDDGAPDDGASDDGAPGPAAAGVADTVGSAADTAEAGARGPSDASASPWLLRYARALGVAFPWYLWLVAIPGLAAPGKARRPDLEALVGLPLVATSVLIARVVAIDPRTQLFIVPLAALYAARGLLVVADAVKPRLAHRIRGGVVTALFVGAVVLDLLGTSAVRLGMSLTVGSPHHVVAAQNAAVGAAIRDATSEDATVMSFHPALALFADRDWRVLPVEPMDRIVRYARTQANPYLVLSVFYPPEIRPLEEPHYLIVSVPTDLPESERWRIDVPEPGTVMAFGELEPVE